MSSSENYAWSNLPVSPGSVLEEEIEYRGMTQKHLAARMGRPLPAINEIIRGKKSVTAETAFELEAVLGVPAHIWTGLETTYRMTLARNKEKVKLESEVDLLREFPVNEMEKRGWMPRKMEKVDKVLALRRFLGIASLNDYQKVNAGAFRITGNDAAYSPGALAAWMRKGELDAQGIDAVADYNKADFENIINRIRTLTCKSADEFLPEMRDLCASAGVLFVITQELPQSGANGVARWLNPRRPMIQMSLKWRWADAFWFTFFHEAAHVLKHKRSDVFVSHQKGEYHKDNKEDSEADSFARDVLISPSVWKEFVDKSNGASFTESSVRRFAADAEIDAGIVVGRLQHEGRLDYSHPLSGLKRRLEWITE